MLKLPLPSKYKAFLPTFMHVAFLCAGMLGAAQPADQVLDINALESAPATVEISPDYSTTIEFGDVEIDTVSSRDGSQILIEVSGGTIDIRADQEDVSTNLVIGLLDGPTVSFNLVSDPDAASSRRYVVSSEQPSANAPEENVEAEAQAQAEAAAEEEETAQTEAAAAEAQAQAAAAEEAAQAEAQAQAEAAEEEAQAEAQAAAEEAAAEEAAQAEAAEEAQAESSQAQSSSSDVQEPVRSRSLPPELSFRTSAYRPNLDSMVIQYILANNTENLLANDPQRLRIYADGVAVPFERTLPEAGQAGRLQAGEIEYGEVFVPNISANASDLRLEWELVEIGPGITYQASSDLLSVLGEELLFTPETATAGVDAATPPQAAEPTTEREAPAASAPDAEPTSQAAGTSAAGESEQSLPPEVLAELRARGSDITVVGFPFDEPGETIISSEEAEENDVSLLNTWSYYARSEAEAQGTVENGEACVNVGGETTLFRVQDVGLNYIGFPLVAGQSYRLFFEASADKPIYFRALVGLALVPYTESFAQMEVLGTQEQSFLYTFEARADSDVNRLGFMLGGNQDAFRICFDNVVLSEVGEVEDTTLADEATEEGVANAQPAEPVGASAAGDTSSDERERFGEAVAAQSWSSYTSQQARMDYEVSGDEVCTVVEEDGAEIWDAGLLRTGLPFIDDQTYDLTFEARADKPLSVRPTVTLDEIPWTEVFGQSAIIDTEVRTYSYTFDAVGLEERGGRLIFFLGGNQNAPYRVCFDNVVITPEVR